MSHDAGHNMVCMTLDMASMQFLYKYLRFERCGPIVVNTYLGSAIAFWAAGSMKPFASMEMVLARHLHSMSSVSLQEKLAK